MAIKHGVKLTADERTAIQALERLQQKWPPSLWLFAASGDLYVMKKDSAGNRVMRHGGYDDSSAAAKLSGIECDGGDW